MKVACIQMEVLPCRKKENLKKAFLLAEKALEKGAEILVFPELFSSGFCYEHFEELAESSPYPTLLELCQFSKTHDCVLIGSILEKAKTEWEYSSNKLLEKKSKKAFQPSNYYNLGFCLESGVLVGTYRKTHPFKKENLYFSKGSLIAPLSLRKRKLKIGLEICYELRFPEVSRKLVLDGAELLVTIAAFPNPRKAHWENLVVARALENQIPHLACNRCGNGASSLSYFGASLIVDALGNIKAEAGEKEALILQTLNLSQKEKVRAEIPIFKDRRQELY